jgi:Uma2 family endonuclease
MAALPHQYRWTRREYERLAELGAFAGKRVELIGGQIVEMPPQGPPHSVATALVAEVLRRIFPPGRFTIRSQDPLALAEYDEPEPALAVVIGAPRDYRTAHPTGEQTLLVVEVADSSPAYDLGAKADLYATAGIADYWVVNLPDRTVEVHRRPSPHPASDTRHRSAERQTVRPGGHVVPLAAPEQRILVDDLLP